MFYQYRQNNSGGSFKVSKADGITIVVIVEADSPKDANYKAEEIGLYFDGCENGTDCECCGDRWYEAYDSDGSEVPQVYNIPVGEYPHEHWSGDAPSVCVHYKDGRKEWFA